MTDRAEKIAKADAEILIRALEAAKSWTTPGTPSFSKAMDGLAAAWDQRAALDRPPKPRLPTPKEVAARIWRKLMEDEGGWKIADEIAIHHREIAELVRTELDFPGGKGCTVVYHPHEIAAARDRIIAALEGT